MPDAFIISGLTPTTARVAYEFNRCARITINDKVFENAGFFETMVFVTPRNDTWEEQVPTGTHYLIETRFDPPEAATEATRIGLVSSAATIAGENVSASGSEAKRISWTAEDERSSFTMEFQDSGGYAERDEPLYHRWTGKGPFRLQEEDMKEVRGLGLEPGVFRLSGASDSRDAFGDAVAMLNGVAIDVQGTRLILEREFV